MPIKMVAAIEDAEALKLMRRLFTKIAQKNNGLTWTDNSKTAGVPYIRLINGRGIAVATLVYTPFILKAKSGTWSKRWSYEIYSPNGEMLYSKAYTFTDLVSAFNRAIGSLVVPYLDGRNPLKSKPDETDERDEHRPQENYRDRDSDSVSVRWELKAEKRRQRELFSGKPRITVREVHFVDVSDKPIQYVDSDEIIASADAQTLAAAEALASLYAEYGLADAEWASQGIFVGNLNGD